MTGYNEINLCDKEMIRILQNHFDKALTLGNRITVTGIKYMPIEDKFKVMCSQSIDLDSESEPS